jgi:hypothetical protein
LVQNSGLQIAGCLRLLADDLDKLVGGVACGLRDRIGFFIPLVGGLLEEGFELGRSEVGAAEKWLAAST